MTRTIQDANLEIWEAYASAGDHGYPERARIVFQSLSDRQRRARTVQRERDKAQVEHEISSLSEAELARLLEQAEEVR